MESAAALWSAWLAVEAELPVVETSKPECSEVRDAVWARASEWEDSNVG